ncbi:MAG: substrate-binding domain-containing protein [Anaerolineales bacterium]|nr:substrate-binding domain-containing protein [Anaerolineales bacterium]
MERHQKSGIENLKLTVPFWRQLRWNLILFFVLLAVVPVAIAITITLYQGRLQATEQVKNQLTSIAELKQGQLTRWIEASKGVLTLFLADKSRTDQLVNFAVFSSPQDQTVTQNTLNNVLSEAVKAQPLFQDFFIYNTKGEVLAASKPTEIGKVVTRQPYFTPSLADLYVQPPYYALGTADLTMLITHPLIDQRGQIVGVLAGRLNLDTLGQIMTDRSGLGHSGETYLVSLESHYLVTPSRFENDGYIQTRAYYSEGINRVLRGEDGSGVYGDYRTPSVTVIGAYRWLSELQVGLLAEIDEAEALATYTQAQNFSILVALVAVAAAAGFGFYNATRIAKPITALTQVAIQITRGDLGQRAEIKEQNEIGLLATTFNTMTAQLGELIGSLEERIMARTHRLEVITDLSGQLVSILDFEQLITEMVNKIKDHFGYYHVQVYLADWENNKLVLAGGTDRAGQTMVAQGHSIPIGRGMVGRAAQRKEVMLAPNLARMIAPEVVTAKNIDTLYQREIDSTHRRQWYHQYITRVFGSLEESAADSKADTRRLKLGYVMSDFGEFSMHIRQGAEDAARDLDLDIEITSPHHADRPDPLVKAFEQHLTAGKDGLVIIPQFQEVWPPYFDRAKQAGIPVVTANLTGPDIANWTWFGQDGYQGGFALAIEFKQILQAAGYQAGQIVVGISGTREAELVARYEGFKAGLAGTAFTCSDLFYSGTIESETAHQFWVEFINAHPNLIAAVGLTAQAVPTLARIKTQTQASWLIAGFDLETATLEALKTGVAQVTIAQHPYLQGYLPVLALAQYLRQDKPLSDWVVEGWLPNPLLPDTKAEISVPINLEDQVVGVLDVQADKVDSLDESDANTLRSLANQVAVAIRNARQFAQVQAALAEAGELQRRYIEQSWDRTRVTRKNVGRVQFSLGESASLDEAIIGKAQQQAVMHKKPTVVNFNDQQDDPFEHYALVAPIMLRDIVIGDLQLHESNAPREWTESELALIRAVVDQVAQAAETLRLLDETQERASREQLISQISNKMRRAPDMESLLKVAVTELSRALNPARTFVRMDLPEIEGPAEVKRSEAAANGRPEQHAEAESVTV